MMKQLMLIVDCHFVHLFVRKMKREEKKIGLKVSLFYPLYTNDDDDHFFGRDYCAYYFYEGETVSLSVQLFIKECLP